MKRIFVITWLCMLSFVWCNAQKSISIDRAAIKEKPTTTTTPSKKPQKAPKGSTATKTTTPQRTTSPSKDVFQVSLTKDTIYFKGWKQYKHKITVTSNRNWWITKTGGAWANIRKDGENVKIDVEANPTNNTRTCTFSITNGKERKTYTVSQAPINLGISPQSQLALATGGMLSFSIYTDYKDGLWEVSKVSDSSWLKYKREGNNLIVQIEPTEVTYSRQNYITIKSCEREERISIKQNAGRQYPIIVMTGSTRNVSSPNNNTSDLAKTLRFKSNCRIAALEDGDLYSTFVYGLNNVIGHRNSDINSIIKQKEKFKDISVNSKGYYCIIYGDNHYKTYEYGFLLKGASKADLRRAEKYSYSGYVPTYRLGPLLQKYARKKNEQIVSVSISDNNHWVLVTNKHIEASRKENKQFIKNVKELFGAIKDVCLTNLGICVVCEKGIAYSNIPANVVKMLRQVDFKPDRVEFTDGGKFFISNEAGRFVTNMTY